MTRVTLTWTLLDFLKFLLLKKKLLIFTGLTLVSIGIITVFTTPKEFTAKAEFLITSNEGGNLAGASSLAQFAGIELPGQDPGNSVSPKVYEEFLRSKDLLIGILIDSVTLSDGEQMLLLDYLENDISENTLSRSIKLVNSLRNWITGSDQDSQQNRPEVNFDVRWITRDFENKINSFSKRILFDYELERSMITMEVQMQDKLVSTVVLDKLSKALERYVETYINQGLTDQINFVNEILIEKKTSFDSVSLELALFRESNRDITSFVSIEKRRELERAENIASQLYLQMQKTYEQSRIEQKKKQVKLRQIDKLSVPTKPSNLRKLYALPIALIVSVVLTLLLMTLLFIYRETKDYIRETNVFRE